MPMMEQQVKHLLEIADRTQNEAFFYEWYNGYAKDLRQAANTIETLSAKLQVANMENGGGWIDFNDKLPNNQQTVLISKNRKTLEDLFEFYFPDKDCEDNEVLGFLEGKSASYDGFVILKDNKDDIAWQPLPEPYHQQQ